MFCGPQAMLVIRLAVGRLQIEPPERHSSHHRAHGLPPAVAVNLGSPLGTGLTQKPLLVAMVDHSRLAARLEATIPAGGRAVGLSLPGWPGRLWIYFLSEGLVEGFLPNRFSNLATRPPVSRIFCLPV
jgi:hypothetical protein